MLCSGEDKKDTAKPYPGPGIKAVIYDTAYCEAERRKESNSAGGAAMYHSAARTEGSVGICSRPAKQGAGKFF